MSKDKKENKSLTKIKKKENKGNGKIKKFFKKFLEILKTKWLVKASTTLLLVLIIFAIYIGGTKILDTVSIPDIDCTKDKLYTLSDETKNRIKNIEKEIDITLINFKSSDSMKNIIDQYKAINKNIKVEEIDDITSRIDLQQEYSIDSSEGLILVSCGEDKVEITEADLYTYDYTSYQQIDLTEEALTNAIVNVTTESKPKVYFADNHAMYPSATYYTNAIKVLEGDANEVESVNLLSTGRVPEDCDTLIITTLKEDFTDPERDYIIDYINNGGNLMILAGQNFSDDVELINFNKILEIYGIKVTEGIILEGDENKMLYGYPDMVIENLEYCSLTKYKELNLNILLVDAGAIEVSESPEDIDVEYETIAETSEKAFLRTNLNISTANRTDLDSEEAAYTVGVLATKTIEDEKTSKLIMFSDGMFTERQLQNYIIEAGNNKDIIANSVAYLNKKENTITIRKNYDMVNYTVTQSEHNIIMGIIFITPFAMIVIGIIVWQVRRRK